MAQCIVSEFDAAAGHGCDICGQIKPRLGIGFRVLQPLLQSFDSSRSQIKCGIVHEAIASYVPQRVQIIEERYCCLRQLSGRAGGTGKSKLARLEMISVTPFRRQVAMAT